MSGIIHYSLLFLESKLSLSGAIGREINVYCKVKIYSELGGEIEITYDMQKREYFWD